MNEERERERERELRRPAVRYYGGKWVLAPWIINHFPPHECYVEPFAGAASCMLRKPRAFCEVMNDLDGDVVNFFRTLRDRSSDLLRAIHLTPFARSELKRALEPMTDVDPVEQARRFYVRACCSFGGPTATIRNGWKYNVSAKSRSRLAPEFADIVHLDLVIERLKGVQIECDDALRVIQRYDRRETLFYVDPPYLASTRCGSWKSGAYRHELLNEDHAFLLEVLRRCNGMVVISGYPSDLYEEELKGWHRIERQASKRSTKADAVEVLWLSPRTMEALAA